MTRSRRRRVLFNARDDRDYASPYELELVEDVLEPAGDELGGVVLEPELAVDTRARRPSSNRPSLPDRVPMPLGALELIWALDQAWMEPFAVRSIELAGGFRPMLERADLGCDSAEA